MTSLWHPCQPLLVPFIPTKGADMTELVTRQHLSDLLELLPDLANERIMEQAWSDCIKE